ncbi:MAG: hypothetical protein M1831_007139 [Alyxoria varia]|nr:MAG: hypothetical protein M1831_007139 [Alyxoria varia]
MAEPNENPFTAIIEASEAILAQAKTARKKHEMKQTLSEWEQNGHTFASTPLKDLDNEIDSVVSAGVSDSAELFKIWAGCSVERTRTEMACIASGTKVEGETSERPKSGMEKAPSKSKDGMNLRRLKEVSYDVLADPLRANRRATVKAPAGAKSNVPAIEGSTTRSKPGTAPAPSGAPVTQTSAPATSAAFSAAPIPAQNTSTTVQKVAADPTSSSHGHSASAQPGGPVPSGPGSNATNKYSTRDRKGKFTSANTKSTPSASGTNLRPKRKRRDSRGAANKKPNNTSDERYGLLKDHVT